jgi:CDP-diacylglycerol--glycerol-3-phosphate 3-phosphatidyltransferase
MKWLPNALSISRFILALSLFLFEPFSVMFIAVYVVAVLTDAMDGLLARRLGAQTKLGDGLDTFADFALVGITLIRIVPVMNFDGLSIAIIISIFALKGLALIVSYVKFKQVISLTTYFSKLLAVVAFMFPFLYWLVKYTFPQLYAHGITENILVVFLGGIGILIMLEELLIHLVSSAPNPNAKGFLFDRKGVAKQEATSTCKEMN